MPSREVKTWPHRGPDTATGARQLANSLRSIGLMHAPAVVDCGGTLRIMFGQRRADAWRRAFGADTVMPVYVLEVWSQAAEWMRKDTHAREFFALQGAVRPLTASEMMRLWLKVWERFNPRDLRGLGVTQAVAEYLGTTPDNLKALRDLSLLLDDPQEEVRTAARQALDDADRGTVTPLGAYHRPAKVRRRLAEGARPTLPAADQRRAFERVAIDLGGVTAALGSVGRLSPDLTAQEREMYALRLSEGRRALERAIRELRQSGEST